MNTTPFPSPCLNGWGETYEQRSGPVRYVSVLIGEIPNLVSTVGKTGMAVGGTLALVLDNNIPDAPDERGLTAFLRQG
ncbi:MAG: hypothetical protein ACO3JL_16465 [Myxococcota bacterium]